MKTPILFVVFLSLFISCSTDVDLYTEYTDIPVVYGLIDAQLDTNYIKITKAFCNDDDNPINPFEAAHVFDSSNYPGRLDAFIEELRSTSGQRFEPTGRSFFLDTLTIHDKKPGVFYSPHQKLYYTTERFNINNGSNKYRYKLYVVKPEGDTVTSETGIVAGDIAVSTPKLNFQSAPSDEFERLTFSSTEEAVLYQIGMQFNYREIHPGQPEVKKEVSWDFGAKPLSMYEKLEGSDRYYRLYYPVNVLFNYMDRAIGNDTVWDENHPNVIRYIDDFYVFISAAGEDFNNYYQYMQAVQSGLSLSSDYSNIIGGQGLFSSRIFVNKTAELSPQAKMDLFKKPWGFRER